MHKESLAVATAQEDRSGVQYLTFQLADEHYALNILQVQEIRGWEKVTRVPNSAAHMKGVINLRGTIVPVIDMRLRFGLEPASYSKETVVVVVRTVGTDGAERSLGLVVDAVSDVLNARENEIRGTPDFGMAVQTDSIAGLVSSENNMVMLLDVPSLMEFEAVQGEGSDT